MKPRVLLFTTSRWFPTARLGMALSTVGFEVDALCPRRHPISSIRSLSKRYVYHFLSPMGSLRRAIQSSSPDLVIPCDDTAVTILHQLHTDSSRSDSALTISALIEHSLGPAQNFPIVGNRTALASLASDLGVDVPPTRAITDKAEIKNWAGRVGFPFVLKSDGTSGGEGVRIVSSIEEAYEGYRQLESPPVLLRAIKRALIDQDTSLFWRSLLRKRYAVSGQAFVQGTEATSTLACWRGSVLAALHFEVVSKRSQTAASTTLRLIENAAMSSACEAIVKKLGLSGLVGFDFVLEHGTGKAFLLEMNPRATQVGHLALGPGRDLAAALQAAVSNAPISERPKVTENQTITLFPHEWLRDPQSVWLQRGYHDVPWDEVAFIRLCVGTRRRQEALYKQRDFKAAPESQTVPAKAK
jgi:hypothetical protein